MPRIRQDHPTLRDLGAVIRAFRDERELTQEGLGDSSGTHRTYVSQTEVGTRNVSFLRLARLLAAMGVSWTEFGRAIDRRIGRDEAGRR